MRGDRCVRQPQSVPGPARKYGAREFVSQHVGVRDSSIGLQRAAVPYIRSLAKQQIATYSLPSTGRDLGIGVGAVMTAREPTRAASRAGGCRAAPVRQVPLKLSPTARVRELHLPMPVPI